MITGHSTPVSRLTSGTHPFRSLPYAGAFLVVLSVYLASAEAFGQAANMIRRGELIHVEVYRVPEMSTSTQVNSEGTIEMPYVGSIHVEGLTEEEASAEVSRALKEVLRNPRVKVSRRGLNLPTLLSRGRTPEMRIEIIPLLNSDAQTMSSVLRGMSSDGGRVSFDPDTNTLVVTDTPQTIQNIMNVVSRLDQMQSRLTQVRIEVKIAEVRIGALKELGVRWWVQGAEANIGFYPPPSQDVNINALKGNLGPSASEFIGDSGGGAGGGIGRRFVQGVFNQRLNIPVHVPVPGQTFLGFTNSFVDIGAMLDALVSDNKAQLLANPMILTVNHKKAVIKMVDEFPYSEFGTEITGATSFSTRFMDLGIILEVTPHVYQDSYGTYVRLDLHPEVSFAIGSNNGIPIRSVRSSQTTANVRDGQTLVIGGILREDERTIESKIPGLGNVPLLGLLFKRKEKTKFRTELMIFVTPTVHRHPQDITWDKMIDISDELKKAALIPIAEIRREARKD